MGGAWSAGLPARSRREALVNAVAHRDYTITVTDIELSIYTDRIEIISPGRLRTRSPSTRCGPDTAPRATS